MEQQRNSDIVKRVERLEQLVEHLSAKVEKLLSARTQESESQALPEPIHIESPPPPPKPGEVPLPPPQKIERPEQLIQPAASAPVPAKPGEPTFQFPEYMKKSEYWLNKIGIALLLFGAVFLFKYSVEQGWLTPSIRILIGLLLGFTLSIFGLRLYKKRRHFSQVLLGGAIGTFYITGYAAFQVFHLVSHPQAFAFFVAVTLLSFVLSIKENDYIFSLIAMLGGLGTPFLLYTGEGSIPGLMFYLCVLLAGASAIYYFKGWWSLFWTTCFGGWTVIAIALYSGDVPTSFTMIEKLFVQLALLLALPFFWLIPLGREITILKKPEILASSIPDVIAKNPNAPDINYTETNLHILTIITPFLSFGLTTVLWQWSDNIWGGICLLVALLFSSTGWWLNSSTDRKNLAYTHFNIGLIFATIGLYYFLDGSTLLVALTLEAVALHLAKIKIGVRTLAPIAHTLFGIVSLWIVGRVFDSPEGAAILNMKTMSDFVVPVCAIVLSFLFKSNRERFFYPILGFALFVAIFFRELNGNDYFITLTFLSAAMSYVTYLLKDKDLFGAVHAFNAGIASWLGYRLIDHAAGNAVFNYTAGADLLFIAYGVILAIVLFSREEKVTYMIAAHAALLLLLLRELSPLDNGQGLVSVAWGVYVVALFILGLRKNIKLITKTAMATLFILIGKLFLVDLANLETIWRVLLFLGIGAALLFLSYFFQSFWKTKSAD